MPHDRAAASLAAVPTAPLVDAPDPAAHFLVLPTPSQALDAATRNWDYVADDSPVFYINQLAMALGTANPKQATRRAITACIGRRLNPARFDTHQQCWSHYGASRSNFLQWQRLLSRALPVSPAGLPIPPATPFVLSPEAWRECATALANMLMLRMAAQRTALALPHPPPTASPGLLALMRAVQSERMELALTDTSEPVVSPSSPASALSCVNAIHTWHRSSTPLAAMPAPPAPHGKRAHHGGHMVVAGSLPNLERLAADAKRRRVAPSSALTAALAAARSPALALHSPSVPAPSPLIEELGWEDDDVPGLVPSAEEEPECDSPRMPMPHRYIIVFSGSHRHTQRLATYIKALDPSGIIEEIDILNDAIFQDLLRPEVAERLLNHLVSHRYDCMVIANDCSSWTIAAGGDDAGDRPQLRSKAEIWGKTPIPDEWLWYLVNHNELAEITFDCIEIALVLDMAWIAENPPGHSDASSAHFWPRFADWPSLFDTPRAIRLQPLVRTLVFDQCKKGAPWRGTTALMYPPDLEPEMAAEFDLAHCDHPSHPHRARGRDAQGNSLSAAKAAYSIGTCESLARVAHAGAARAAARSAARAQLLSTLGDIVIDKTDDAGALQLWHITNPLHDLLIVDHESHLKEAASRLHWRLACQLILFESVDIAALLSGFGAGFRLGTASHIAALPPTYSPTVDPRGKRRFAAACKAAEHLVQGKRVLISPALRHTPGGEHALAWLITQLALRRAGSHRMHIGSSKPHASAHVAAQYTQHARPTPSGSLRQLEAELDSVLRAEPTPACNMCITTQPDPPRTLALPPSGVLPGPFTTEQLIPAPALDAATSHKQAIMQVIERRRRGDQGLRAALAARPKRVVMEETEVLTEQARGYHYLKHPTKDEWRPLLPSTLESPPGPVAELYTVPGEHLRLQGRRFLADSIAKGMPDLQMAHWGVTGYPGAPGMDDRRLVLWYPHGGALDHVDHFESCALKDQNAGFVSIGSDFPIVWPCTVDPFNIVMRYGKPRLTIDKSLEKGREPFPVRSYNKHVDLIEDSRKGLRVTLVRVSQFSRGVAIFLTCDAPFEVGKYDLQTFFRVRYRQMLDAHQSGGITPLGYRTDWCTNFGESDAPDHCSRESNGCLFFIRSELRRLDTEYPPRHPAIIKWRDERRAAFQAAVAAKTVSLDESWRFLDLFIAVCFIDDKGLGAFADHVFDTHGVQQFNITHDGAGSIVRTPVKRSAMYLQAAMAISRYYGHGTPEDKVSPMARYLVFLGVGLDLDKGRRLLSRDKREAYTLACNAVLNSPKVLPNGLTAHMVDEFDSLVHKLLHASEVIPLGRQHLWHCRDALKHPNELEWRAVIVSQRARAELVWWVHQLAKSDDLGLPLASRCDFPTVGDDDHIIEYHDASRTPGDVVASGFGAWTIIRNVFCFIVGRWTHVEIDEHSINVLESHVRDMGTFTFVHHARSLGCSAKHATAFSDNRTAEANAEFGRPGTALLNLMLQQRQEEADSISLHLANDRVASVDNDIADLLSRGDVYEALRFPRAAELKVLRLEVDPARRRIPQVPQL